MVSAQPSVQRASLALHTENIVEHKDSVLPNPVPRRVKVTGLKGVENRLDTINICVTVFKHDVVQPSLNLH